MKLKTLYLFVLIVMSFVTIFPLYSQENDSEKKTEDKGGTKDGVSYFSQDEMQFVLGEKEQPWNYGRITLSPFYIIGIGKFVPIIPYSTGFLLSFDHGIQHAFKPAYRKKSPLIPGLKLELAYNIYGSVSIGSLSITGGPIWLFPLDNGNGGDITLSSTIGMNFMRGQIGNPYFSNDALYLTASLGYELSFSKIFFSLEGRFSYIFDSLSPWMGVGGLLGVGYKFTSASSSEREGNVK